MTATPFLRACAFLRSTPARLALLREAAGAAGELADLARSLELHGILPLAARNLRAARVPLPEDVARLLDERERVLREEGRRDALTVDRLLAAANRAELPVVLLKGASLAQDLYDDPLLRSQGDVDVLVSDDDVRPLVAAATEAGLVEGESALPIWWHRLTHFHLKLEPALAMLKEVEVHWRLHHAALGLCVSHAALLARTHAISVGQHRARTLDPLDRFLHLVTHLTSHWVRLPAPTVENLDEWLAADPPRVRLKWFVDLAAEAERLAADVPPAELALRAREWGAHGPLDFVTRTLVAAFPLDDGAVRWLEAARADVAPDPGSAPRPAAAAATRPLAALDFRREALALWPRWLWPARTHWAVRAPQARGLALLARRLLHAGGVLARSLASALLLPAALVARPLFARSRRRRRREALAPERVLDVVTAWRAGTGGDPSAGVPGAGSDAIDV